MIAPGDGQDASDASDAAFARRLLDSARSDQLSDRAVERAWSRFSLDAVAVAATGGTERKTLLRAARRAGLRGLLAGVVLGSGLTGLWLSRERVPSAASAVTGKASAAAHEREAREPAQPAAPAPAPAAAEARAPAAHAPAADAAPRAATARRPLHAGSTRHRAEPGALPAPGRAASTLDAEAAALDEARAAFASGAAAHALHLIDAYHHAFPAGQLSADAEALAVEALVAGSQPEQAQARAHRFLARYPRDPHAARIAALAARPRPAASAGGDAPVP